ncbi:MAG: hypothetical protein R6U96_07190 [Promethearchaeia archaeon]
MIMAVLAIVAARCNALENIFILLMSFNPTKFPSLYAIAHSPFALVKRFMLGILIIWELIAALISLIKK